MRGFFSLRHRIRHTLSPTHWLRGATSAGVKRPRHEVDHYLRPVPRLRMRGTIRPLPLTPLWRGTWLSTAAALFAWNATGLGVGKTGLSKISHTLWTTVLTNQLNICSRVLIEKFSAFYEIRKFITVFTRARPWSLSSGTLIQLPQPFYYFEIHFNIIFPSMICQIVSCMSSAD